MDIPSLIGGIIGGAISATGIITFFAKSIKERWIESVKASYAVELESIKSRLDQGNYVTKAQYDLELGAYKDLWIALSDLRTHARALFGIDFFYPKATNTSGRDDAKKRSMVTLKDAHNTAIQTSDHMAPFYAKEVQTKARTITFHSNSMVQHAREWAADESALEWKIVKAEVETLSTLIEELDAMIRDRLTSLRVIH